MTIALFHRSRPACTCPRTPGPIAPSSSTAAAPLAFACASVQANEPAERTVPIRAELGFERITLPGDEQVGLVGGSVLFPIADRWWAGLGRVWRGHRAARRTFRRWRGAEARVGTALGVGPRHRLVCRRRRRCFRTGRRWTDVARRAARCRATSVPCAQGSRWSHVRFPSGDIQSSQWGVLLSWQRPFRYFDVDAAGQRQPAGEATGLGFRRIAGTVGTYSLRGSDSRRIGLVGGRAEWAAASQGLFTGIEAAAAASGGAAGYMEILGTVGWRIAPWTVAAAAHVRRARRARARWRWRGTDRRRRHRQADGRRQLRLGPWLAHRHRRRCAAWRRLVVARERRAGVGGDGPRAAERRTRQRHHQPQRMVGDRAATGCAPSATTARRARSTPSG